METLEDMGNCVKIRTQFKTKLVPAINIQVEYISENYGIYFEIMFEDGALWVINRALDVEYSTIYVTEHINWASNICAENDWAYFTYPDWTTFLMMYETKANFHTSYILGSLHNYGSMV